MYYIAQYTIYLASYSVWPIYVYRVTAKELISEALAHPEQQMASGDSEMKVMKFYLSHKLNNLTH